VVLIVVLLGSLTGQPGEAQTGEFRAGAGAMTGIGADGSPGKFVTTASFSFVKSRFSLGPEILYAFGENRIFGIGAVSRFRIGSSPLHPYLVAGLGGNYWRADDFVTAGLFTGNLGAGLSLTRGETLGVTLELRAYRNLQNYSGGGNWDFVSITSGVRLGW
jgi:hypothetical protein